MPDSVELLVGQEPWTLTVPASARVELAARAACRADAGRRAELVRDALEHPFEFEAMRRALTPDDHVTIVLDATLAEGGGASSRRCSIICARRACNSRP